MTSSLNSLASSKPPLTSAPIFSHRRELDWINDWKSMHHTLFNYVYRECGQLRPRGHDVRFGAPGDEDLHRIPCGGAEVYNELYALARTLCDRIEFIKSSDIDETCRFLAQFHYNFIRIHPFFDGNGRIARVVTDQLSVALGYIPIIAGFPQQCRKSAFIMPLFTIPPATAPAFH